MSYKSTSSLFSCLAAVSAVAAIFAAGSNEEHHETMYVMTMCAFFITAAVYQVCHVVESNKR